MTLEVVKPGLLTTPQDAGRPGFAHLGIGRAGAFDPPALHLVNVLCGNPCTACALEITLLGPTLRFRRDTWVAVAGAPIAFRVEGHDAPAWTPVFVRAGATVALGAIREGCRSYLAVGGGFDVAPVLGSRSTDVNARLGPFDGRPLRAGDVLETGLASFPGGTRRAREAAGGNEPDPVSWRLDPRPWFVDDPKRPLRLLPGHHLDGLSNRSRNLLFSGAFKVHANSNRAGLRLTGPRLEWDAPVEMVSEGCVPGLLQLPPSGQPIAFGPECPVSGGYPRIGQVAAVDIPRLAQLRPGDALRFAPCTFDEAVLALHQRERALRALETRIAARLAG
ncbi:MAG TPA: biotin-dependent carboxyltransferase family protein [Rhodanobacteraceae bacterium]|nr:biotin-dependent carboxyltransferase family protein [Rhodanobacteraceae bacterium]